MGQDCVRKQLELREYDFLSEFAAHSGDSMGRDRNERKCEIRTDFQRDKDRILYSKAFRRLMHKTQVFLAPEGDHYSTRMLHTLEVAQISRTIARALDLNEDLCEAIALGHDLGHTPFGHAGERALNEVCNEGFKHNEQSVRIVEVLENNGRGLNLTKEVRDGILNHQSDGKPFTLEGKIVKISDKIAYINRDIDDACRAKIMKEEDIPTDFSKVLGNTADLRYTRIISDIIENSRDINDIRMSKIMEIAFYGLRGYMFNNVYTNPVAKSQEKKAENMIVELYNYYMHHFDELPKKYKKVMDKYGDSKEKVVCDYISGMTDRYAVSRFRDLIIPVSWGY